MTNAFVAIGADGDSKDAHEWVDKLVAMYIGWATSKGLQFYKYRTSAVWIVDAYDLLAGETGVHSLTRFSPFDPEHLRTTSFAHVNVMRDEYKENPVRSYTLDPYHLVKDNISGIETEDTAAVLRGEIDGFLGRAHSA